MKRLRGTHDDGYTNRSECVEALLDAGLSLLPEPTGICYSARELLSIRETPGGTAFDNWRDRRSASMQAVAGRREERIAS